MRLMNRLSRQKIIGMFCAMGTLCQFSSCDIGSITTTTTVDGREALISLIRGVLLTPLDQFITDAVNEAFGADQ